MDKCALVAQELFNKTFEIPCIASSLGCPICDSFPEMIFSLEGEADYEC